MKVMEGKVLSILIDQGTVLLQESVSLGDRFEMFDFCEFENLGLVPDELWEGRLCRVLTDRGELIGARIK